MKKILEKSGNFVRGKKWEPCKYSTMFLPLTFIRIQNFRQGQPYLLVDPGFELQRRGFEHFT